MTKRKNPGPQSHMRDCAGCGKQFVTKYHKYCEPCRVSRSVSRYYSAPDHKKAKAWLPFIKDLQPITYAAAADAWGLPMGQESIGRVNLMLHLGYLVNVGPGKFDIVRDSMMPVSSL